MVDLKSIENFRKLMTVRQDLQHMITLKMAARKFLLRSIALYNRIPMDSLTTLNSYAMHL